MFYSKDKKRDLFWTHRHQESACDSQQWWQLNYMLQCILGATNQKPCMSPIMHCSLN